MLRGPFGSHRRAQRRRFGFESSDVYQRIAEVLPLVETAQQGTDSDNAMLPEFQRHTGAGGFVGSSTEQHDLTTAGDFTVPRFQFLG